MTSAISRADIEKNVQQLYMQLEELRAAIQALQTRSLELTNEIQEIRLAYETLSSIQQYGQSDTLTSLDRYGYVYVKVQLIDKDKAIVRITKDLYALLPIDEAKNILLSFERDITDELRKVEADLKQLLSIYNQVQKKLQEYLALLVGEEPRRTS
ncbi:MAG: prefoldin subunit alpha [Desulfurococcaceae archaeon]|jgi:prefoldin alpha subunit|nr:prefoldin subunit alpha [Desulfurococcaceae archaeon]MCC6058290.1 prefoldin subunit alpha [Desulfurococcaceae archaeon]